MQYALVKNIRSLPEKGKIGTCCGCGQEVISKCGSLKIHHWAHKSIKDCDTWYEPETSWHREWKNKFPESYREKVFKDPINGELHRADVHTEDNVTLEFQNSSISIEEFKQRNSFYKKLIWVVNGLHFKNNFDILGNIPNPLGSDLSGFEIYDEGYYKKTDIEELEIPRFQLYKVYSLNDEELKDIEVSYKHYKFSWTNKRKVWYCSNALVFIDFGGDILYWLRKKEQILSHFWYLQSVKKVDFIGKYSHN